MMIQAVLGNPYHPEYGVATIPFPIPHDQYAHCMELLEALEIGDAVKADCQVQEINSFYSVLKRMDMLKDAPIIILDEATANVDPENEDRLQKAIEALTHEKTVIMIAHRLKTVRCADQILVLDGGQIVQKGTHAQLAGQEGIYRNFIAQRQQAAGWKM